MGTSAAPTEEGFYWLRRGDHFEVVRVRQRGDTWVVDRIGIGGSVPWLALDANGASSRCGR